MEGYNDSQIEGAPEPIDPRTTGRDAFPGFRHTGEHKLREATLELGVIADEVRQLEDEKRDLLETIGREERRQTEVAARSSSLRHRSTGSRDITRQWYQTSQENEDKARARLAEVQAELVTKRRQLELPEK